MLSYTDKHTPDSKVHVANMGPTWILSAPDGPMLAPSTLLSRMFLLSGISVMLLHAPSEEGR